MIRNLIECLIALGRIGMWLCARSASWLRGQQPRKRVAAFREEMQRQATGLRQRSLLALMGAAFYIALVVVQTLVLLAFLPIPLAVGIAVLVGTLVARRAGTRLSRFVADKLP